MATHDYNLANQDGASFRSDLNNALAAIVSNNSSSTAPATTFAHQIWVDTTANVIKQRNAANDAWVELWRIDGGFNAKTFSSNITLNAQSDLRFADSDSSNWVAFQAPATVASNVTWTLPSADGSSGEALTTNGSGTLSWSSASADAITEGNTSAEVVDTGSDGHFKVVTEGTERLRIDNEGHVVAGSNTSRKDWFNFSSSYGSRYTSELSGDNDSLRISYAAVRNSDSVDSGFLAFGKSRGTSNGSVTVVQSGDALGEITFQGADGSELVQGASIKVEVDGTPGANDMPGRILFRTTADGASAPTERMRITSSGRVGVGATSPLGRLDSSYGGYTAGQAPALMVGADIGGTITRTASTRKIGLISCPHYDNGTDVAMIRCDSGSTVTELLVGGTAEKRGATNISFYTASSTTATPAEGMRLDSSGNLKFNSGFGSAGLAYGCRAWVNFQGTGTVTIREDGNVSSVTDNGTGQYAINFANAMPDDNYCMAANGNPTHASFMLFATDQTGHMTTTVLKVQTRTTAFVLADSPYCQVAVFR